MTLSKTLEVELKNYVTEITESEEKCGSAARQQEQSNSDVDDLFLDKQGLKDKCLYFKWIQKVSNTPTQSETINEPFREDSASKLSQKLIL